MKTTMTALLAILMLLLSGNAMSQVAQGKLTNIEKKNAALVIRLLNEMRGSPTLKLTEHFSVASAQEELFYRNLMSKYLDEEKHRKLFEKDSSHGPVEVGFDLYRHLLYSLDFALDKLSPDKVIVRSKTVRKGQAGADNSVDLILIIADREIPMANFCYDASLKKFAVVQFLGYDNNSGIAEFWKGAE